MADFRDTLRAELVAAAAQPVPRRRPRPSRGFVFRTGAVALAAAAVAVGAIVLPRGDDRPPEPALKQTLPGVDLFGGSLEPGVRYRTRALQPPISFRANGDRWFVQDATSASALMLQWREGDPTTQGGEKAPVVFLVLFRMPTVIDPDTNDVRPAPDDLVGWLRANPNLGVTQVSRTTLYGKPATRLDFRIPVHPPRVDPVCHYTTVTVDTEPPRVIACAALAPDVSPPAGAAGRLLVPDGKDPLMAAQVSFDPARVGQIARDSKPLLDSVLIGR